MTATEEPTPRPLPNGQMVLQTFKKYKAAQAAAKQLTDEAEELYKELGTLIARFEPDANGDRMLSFEQGRQICTLIKAKGEWVIRERWSEKITS